MDYESVLITHVFHPCLHDSQSSDAFMAPMILESVEQCVKTTPLDVAQQCLKCSGRVGLEVQVRATKVVVQ